MHPHRFLASDTPKPVAADACVAWIGGPPPDDEAMAVWETLILCGLRRYADVVADVGDRLFRRDLTRVGGAADIGFFQTFYQAYARQLLRRLDGRLVRVGAGDAP